MRKTKEKLCPFRPMGTAVAKARMALGLSKKQLAKDVLVSIQTIINIENGITFSDCLPYGEAETMPTTLERIAARLMMDIFVLRNLKWLAQTYKARRRVVGHSQANIEFGVPVL